MFILKPYGFGYKYYENNTIQIGVTQQENLLDQTISDYVDELGENGYYVYSIRLKNDITYKHSVIKKSNINDDKIKKFVKDNIIVSVFATKLSINDDEYYFKSENECNDFVNELKKYNEDITTENNSEIIEMTEITDKQALQEKIEAYRIDKEKRDKEARQTAERKKQKQVQVTSRSGGYSRIENSDSSQHPLDSYTCISSEFGPRWGRTHTGVDFATPVGTEVHA
jgi:murein DD-endopeptidase MepM/ murein hydrolase activator NlpD